ncbi:Pih1d3 [Scenedesmus sp. PABB004]|nr:Pih1d3 [Scenedesmus sp. PABB004]
MADFAFDIEALSRLLSQAETSSSRPGPAAIGPEDLLAGVKVAAPRGRDKGEARVDEAARQAEAELDADDGREVPQHEFRYKQCVTPADNFLGMSGKDPSSACCDELVVAVALPLAESAAGAARRGWRPRGRPAGAGGWAGSPAAPPPTRRKLFLHLPHKVDAERGRAVWDGKKRSLSVTLRIQDDRL